LEGITAVWHLAAFKIEVQTMKFDEIKRLAKLLNDENLSVIEYGQGDIHIRLESQKTAGFVREPQPMIPQMPEEMPSVEETSVDFNNADDVKSPMVGVFYQSPSPEEEPYVKVGSKVAKGDTLCIIEAMKLMNEITADQDGEIVDVCVNNGDVVEYGQILFKIC
jgi:acetyl-CoA carboxylase biotin carboxyl carrier protein